MSVSISFGGTLPSREPARPDHSAPFRILVVSDLGAEKSWGKPAPIDRDDFDAVMARLNVHMRLQLTAGPAVEFPIRNLDDLHPDQLYENLDLFAALRERRSRLLDASTYDEEAAAILASQSQPDVAEPKVDRTPRPDSPAEPPTESPSDQDTADLLSASLELTQAQQQPLLNQFAEGTVDLDAYVRRLVAPYVVAKPDPRQAEFLASVDEAIAETMREVLHHAEFQRLESAWRGIRFLIRRLQTDSTLQVAVLNVSQHELGEDLQDTEDLTQSKLHKLLVDDTSVSGAQPWTMIIGAYDWSSNPADCALLGRIGRICAASGSVFLSGALPSIAGCPGFQSPDPADWNDVSEEVVADWNALRSLPESDRLGLILPRIMSRRPYGAHSDEIESFAFEELAGAVSHQCFAWMNGTFAIATLLGQAFSAAGWRLSGALLNRIGDLPMHIYSEDGEECVKPCAEAELTDRAATRLSECGLTVIRSIRDEDAVVVPDLKSLSEDSPRLSGMWQ